MAPRLKASNAIGAARVALGVDGRFSWNIPMPVSRLIHAAANFAAFFAFRGFSINESIFCFMVWK